MAGGAGLRSARTTDRQTRRRIDKRGDEWLPPVAAGVDSSHGASTGAGQHYNGVMTSSTITSSTIFRTPCAP
jgi:hypothetical protein